MNHESFKDKKEKLDTILKGYKTSYQRTFKRICRYFLISSLLKISVLFRHKRVFLHQQVDSQRTISQKLNISCHGVQCVLKKMWKLDIWR